MDYALEHGFEVYDTYVDDGVSGTGFDRPGFMRMLEDIKAGKINLVLIKDLSRFGRNYSMTSYYRDTIFLDYGVRLIAMDGSFDSDSEDNDIAPFLDVMNEHYAKQTSKKMKQTRNIAAKNGMFMGSVVPYGYRRDEADKHHLVVDEEAASKDHKKIPVPQEQWIRVENTHEPLVDPATFHSVQALFQTNKNCKPRRTIIGNEPSLFSNLLRCMDCGSKLNFNSWKRKNGTAHFYRCSRYIDHPGSCTPHRIALEELSKAVFEDIRRNAHLAREDKFMADLCQQSRQEQTAEITRLQKQADMIGNRAKQIDGMIRAAFEKNVSGALPDASLSILLQTYQNEKCELETGLPALTAAIERATSQSIDVTREVAELKKYAEVTELTRDVVTRLIRCITISEPKTNGKERHYEIDIHYRFERPRTAPDMAAKENTTPLSVVSSDLGTAV